MDRIPGVLSSLKRFQTLLLFFELRRDQTEGTQVTGFSAAADRNNGQSSQKRNDEKGEKGGKQNV
jgi:hypothetical protein